MDFVIIFGSVIAPLFLMGLFAAYKVRQTKTKEQTTQETRG